MSRTRKDDVGRTIAEIAARADYVSQFVKRVTSELDPEDWVYVDEDSNRKYQVKDVLNPVVQMHADVQDEYPNTGVEALAVTDTWEAHKKYLTSEFDIDAQVAQLGDRPAPKVGWEKLSTF